MSTDLGGHRLQALTQLVNLDGETGQCQGFAAACSVLLDQGPQLRATVDGGLPDLCAGSNLSDGQLPALIDKLDACSFDASLQVKHPHCAAAPREPRRPQAGEGDCDWPVTLEVA